MQTGWYIILLYKTSDGRSCDGKLIFINDLKGRKTHHWPQMPISTFKKKSKTGISICRRELGTPNRTVRPLTATVRS